MKKQLALLIIIITISSFRINSQCLTDAHSNYPADQWLSCNLQTNPNPTRGNTHWILYDLGQSYTLLESHIWNYNASGNTDKGFKNVGIDYSLNGTNWTQWGTMLFPQASGLSDYVGFTGPDFASTNARYVLFTAIDGWTGTPTCLGLGEVKIFVKNCSRMGLDTLVLSHATCNTGADGSLEVMGKGGLEPYTYSWSIGSTTSQISNLTAGQYTVTITDQNNCTVTQAITIDQPTLPGITCLGNDTIGVDILCQAIVPDYRDLVSVFTCGYTLLQIPDPGDTIMGCGIDTTIQIIATYGSGQPDTCTFLLTTEDRICCPLGNDSILYVNHLAAGKNTGLNWSDAATSVQKALAVALSCPTIREVWVAQGEYFTTKNLDRSESFHFLSSLRWYGGFTGTESLLSQRNHMTNVTKLSGDIGTKGSLLDNAMHVLYLGDGIDNLMLDGFTIEAGMADGGGIHSQGSGLLNEGGIVLRNVIIQNCTGMEDGQIILNEGSNSNLTLDNCTIYFKDENGVPVLNQNNGQVMIRGEVRLIKEVQN